MSNQSVHTPSCGRLERLAERAQDKLVCRCTCGALHLVWENATVQLRAHDLTTLLHALHLGHVAPFRVLHEDAETVRVWLYNTGLNLNSEDLATFTSLIAQAEAALSTLELPAPDTDTEFSSVRHVN